MTYKHRVVDDRLVERLRSARVVVIEGPKACGKTETARQVARSEVLLDVDVAARQALSVDPLLVLNGPEPRLIDGWQIASEAVWNNARRLADERRRPGQFILTGSATPDDNPRRHTGAGRMATLRMRPLSLFEAGSSTGAVSLAALLAGERPRCPDPGFGVRDAARVISVGGWPANLTLSVAEATRANRDYLKQIREVDVNRLGAARRDPLRLDRFLQSLARNVATEASVKTLTEDTAAGATDELARTTTYEYLDILERLMIVEDQPAWPAHIRSKATLRQAPKRHFVDPSLAVAALRAEPARLMQDLNALGCLFESLVVRDLRILAPPEGTVYHYRDSKGREADAVLQLPDGRWGAFEMKLGASQVDAGARALLKFASQIDTSKAGPPKVLGVITVSSYGYVRDDGVAVIPIAALGP